MDQEQRYFCHLYPSHFIDRLSTYSLSITKNSNLLISVVLLWTPCPEAKVLHCHDRFEGGEKAVNIGTTSINSRMSTADDKIESKVQ